MIWEELEEVMIFVDLEVAQDTEALDILGNAMIRAGYARAAYVDALLERERNFPTGLDIQGIGVAIPHTDACHVKKEGIAVASLKKPVPFYLMGEEDVQIPVSLIFMLAVQRPDSHLKHLQGILDIIQDTKTLERLLQAKERKEIIQIIKEKESA